MNTRSKTPKICLKCGITFFPWPNNPGKYCSVRCSKLQPWRERFWKYVTKTETCWQWTSNFDKDGYGRLSAVGYPGGYIRAHRASWELHNGPVPNGLWVLHSCDNPPCVNPAHLFLGDCGDNTRDMWTKGRKKRTNVKLTEDNVRAIRTSVTSGRVLAKLYGVSFGLISHVRNRRAWASIE